MNYNPSYTEHPYAPDPTVKSDDLGATERALDCVSTSSSSTTRSASGSSSSSSASASSACSCTSQGGAAGGDGADKTEGHRPCRHHRHPHHCHPNGPEDGIQVPRSASSQGLWASGGSLCNCPAHSTSSNGLDTHGRRDSLGSVNSNMSAANNNVSNVPVTCGARTFARDGSNFFRGSLQELSPAAVAVATQAAHVDPAASATPTRDGHVYNAATGAAPRGRQVNASPLPPRPRTSSAGPVVGGSSGSNASVTASGQGRTSPLPPPSGFASSPSRFLDLGSGVGAPHTHPYQATLHPAEGALPPPPLSHHQRQPSVSSVHSAAGSGQSTPLAAPRPPRHPSEERATMAAVWVDIPPSPVVPFVPSHLESQQRRRTPRRGSAPPSPATSTLAASLHSGNSASSSPQGQPSSAHHYNASATSVVDGELYSCPPPLPERAPLTSPTASVSSASPEVSPSSQLFVKERKGTTDKATTAQAAASNFPSSPPVSEPSRSPNAMQPPGSYTSATVRVDVPPASAGLFAFRLPNDVAEKLTSSVPADAPPDAAAGVTTRSTKGPTKSTSTHSLDISPHTRVALPPPASIGHRSLFPKRSTSSASSSGQQTPTYPPHTPGQRSTADAGADSADDGVASTTSSSTAVRVAPPPPPVPPGLPVHYVSGAHPSPSRDGGSHQTTTVVTVRSSAAAHPLGYTAVQETFTHVSPKEEPNDASAVLVSPASLGTQSSPTAGSPVAAGGADVRDRLADTGAGADDELVSSVSEGEDDVMASDATGAATSSEGGPVDDGTLDRMMDAVRRAKERAARREV